MKNFDEIIFNDNFEDIICDETDFCYLFDLKKYIEEKISGFNNISFSPNTSEREKILAKYGKDKQNELKNLKKNLVILREKLNNFKTLDTLDAEYFFNTLSEDKLSKLSNGDIIFIAQKLGKKSLYSFIDKIEILKLSYIFKKNCPDFLERDLKVLKEFRDSKFPPTVSPEVQRILDSGKFEPKSDNSNER